MRIAAPEYALCKTAQAYDKFPKTPDDVLDRYLEWRDEQLYVCGVTDEGKIIWWKAKKRGTNRYVAGVKRKVETKIQGWLKRHGNLNYWKFLTLTVPETDLGSIRVFRHRWNVFLTNLRKRYPKMRVFRVYELQQRGAVHLHAIIWGIKWIPKKWLRDNWSGRPQVQRPKSIRGILKYITKYLTVSFTDVYTQAFMWFWRLRQWACNFPCPGSKTNSNPGKRIWGLGVCVLHDLEFSFNSIWCSLVEFLKANACFLHQVRWILVNIPHENGLSFRRSELREAREPSGGSHKGAFEQIAEILRHNWLDIRRETLKS